MEITAKTDNFLKAIMKYADDQRNEMHSEVDKLKEEKIKEAEKKAACKKHSGRSEKALC